MALDVHSLVKLLEQEHSSYQQLLVFSNQEQAAIIQNRHADIEKLVKRKELVLGTINEIYKRKQTLLSQIAQELQLPTPLRGVEDIIDHLPEPYKKNIALYIKRIKEMLVQLKAVNFSNGKLINYSLCFLNYFANSLTPETASCTYTASGGYKKSQRKGHFEYCL